jgi:hypothetical protein
MFVKPGHRKDDSALPLIVRGPNKRLLSPRGEHVPEITFWHRRARDGDVVLAEPPATLLFDGISTFTVDMQPGAVGSTGPCLSRSPYIFSEKRKIVVHHADPGECALHANRGSRTNQAVGQNREQRDRQEDHSSRRRQP